MRSQDLARIIALREVARARKAKVSTDVREYLHPRQQDVWDCNARIIKLLCGRRAGKTYFAVLWLLYGALTNPGTQSVYLALTKDSARKIVWETMLVVGAEVFGLDQRHFVEHTLTIKLPNGSKIYVVGTDDRRTIETWRGNKLWRAVIDEMGSQIPASIKYFVKDIIWPALGDLLGSLLLLGTPGLTCEGYWWDRTKPDVLEADSSAFHWTIRENPALPHWRQIIAETLDEFDITEEDEGFRREWNAEWVQDEGAIVYPYDVDRNSIIDLPELSTTGIIIPRTAWRYVIGNDVGVVDECAWVVWAWTPAWRGAIAIDCHIEQLEPDPAGVKGQAMYQEYRDRGQTDYMLDTGGMGKTHEVLYRRKYDIPCIAAEKNEKASAIRELRGDLLSGAAKCLDGPHMNPLREQWASLGWCPKKLQHNPAQPDHLADAGLYGHRRVRHYTHRPDAHQQPPAMGTPDRRLHDFEQSMERRARRRNRSSDRGGRLER